MWSEGLICMPSILIRVPEEASGGLFLKRPHRLEVPSEAGQKADVEQPAATTVGSLLLFWFKSPGVPCSCYLQSGV